VNKKTENGKRKTENGNEKNGEQKTVKNKREKTKLLRMVFCLVGKKWIFSFLSSSLCLVVVIEASFTGFVV